MTPTPGDVHVNTPLTNISIAFIQNAANFVADSVFPNIPVSKQSDRYYTYDRGEFNRDEMKERGPGAESEGGGYTVDNTPTYFATVYAFHRDIDDQLRANADSVLALDMEATTYVTQKALLKREKLWVSKYFVTGVWTAEKAGQATADGTHVIYWSSANSTPIEDVRTARRNMMQSTGFEANKIVMGRAVFDALLDHAEIIDRIKYGQSGIGAPAMASIDALSQLFGVQVVVMNAIENTAKEGQTAVHSFIGGKHAVLVHAAPTPGLMTPSAGYTFSWTGMFGSGASGGRIKSFRQENLAADRVEIEMSFDQKLVSADLGSMFLNVVQ